MPGLPSVVRRNPGIGSRLVDHDMDERPSDTSASAIHEIALEPVRAPARGGGDEDLSRVERRDGVVDRPQRIGVADSAVSTDPCSSKAVQATAQSHLGGQAGRILVRGPVPNVRV